MYPFLLKRGQLFLYFAAWIPLTLLLTLLLWSRQDLSPTEAALVGVPLGLLYAVVCLSATYVCRYQPLATTSPARVAATVLAAGLLSSSLLVLLGRGWTELLDRTGTFEGLRQRYSNEFVLLFSVGFLLFLLAVAAHYLAISFQDSAAAERKAFEMRLLAREAELRALRLQIDPHFLFNSLNSLSALTSQDPASARRMCLRLAAFLRQSLRLGGEKWISLSQEMDLVRDYLEVERIRRSGALSYTLEVPPDAAARMVPPLILQPLVENAVKHGIAQLSDGGRIRVAADLLGDRLRIRIDNPIDDEGTSAAAAGAGVGQRNVRDRLEQLYGKEAGMHLERGTRGYRVELRFPAAVGGKENVHG